MPKKLYWFGLKDIHAVLDPFAVAGVTVLGKRSESRVSPAPFVTGESMGFRFNEWGF